MPSRGEVRVLRGALADLVLGSTDRAAHGAAQLTKSGAWPTAIALANNWRIIPQVAMRVAALGLKIDVGARSALRRREVEAAAVSTFVVQRSTRVLARLEERGIEAVAFKGVGLVGNLYVTPARRMVSDLDLLLDERHLELARSALTAEGFTRLRFVDAPWSLSDVEAFARDPGWRSRLRNLGLVVVDGDGFEIDIHWRIGLTRSPRWDVAAVMARAERVELNDISVRVAAPVDAMLLTIDRDSRRPPPDCSRQGSRRYRDVVHRGERPVGPPRACRDRGRSWSPDSGRGRLAGPGNGQSRDAWSAAGHGERGAVSI